MTARLTLEIPGAPVPKQRARSGQGRHYTPDRTVNAENAIAWEARAARVTFPAGVDVELRLTFGVHTFRGDIDNLEKLVMDALQKGGVYTNDRQVKRKVSEIIDLPRQDPEFTLIEAEER